MQSGKKRTLFLFDGAKRKLLMRAELIIVTNTRIIASVCVCGCALVYVCVYVPVV